MAVMKAFSPYVVVPNEGEVRPVQALLKGALSNERVCLLLETCLGVFVDEFGMVCLGLSGDRVGRVRIVKIARNFLAA